MYVCVCVCVFASEVEIVKAGELLFICEQLYIENTNLLSSFF